MALQKGGLSVFVIPDGIEPELGNQDWTVSRDILEAGEVARLGIAIFKVDIECAEVRIPGFQVFGAGVVSVTDGQVRSLLPAEVNDLLQGGSDL